MEEQINKLANAVEKLTESVEVMMKRMEEMTERQRKMERMDDIVINEELNDCTGEGKKTVDVGGAVDETTCEFEEIKGELHEMKTDQQKHVTLEARVDSVETSASSDSGNEDLAAEMRQLTQIVEVMTGRQMTMEKKLQFILNERMDEELHGLKPELHKNVMFFAAKEGRLEDLKYLIERSGVPMSGRSKAGKHLLDLAIQNGSREITEYIMQRVAELKLDDKERKKLMLQACERGDLDVIEYMHLQGVELTVTDDSNDQLTPIHIASKHGQLEVLKYLSSIGADLSVQDRYGSTPIHHACRSGQLDVIRFLHEQGVDISAKDNFELTPLHSASRYGKLDAVKLLHKLGADVKARDEDGLRPVHWAGETQREAIIAYLTPFSK